MIREPLANEPRYWAGVPGVYQDPADGAIHLVYRIRRPRGAGPDRGAEL